ncbi:MAG: 50S ribosomal protein L33 [Legionellaceae bacterium]
MAAVTIRVKMKSTESDVFYTTTKNPRNHPEKMELTKYDWKLRKHVLFKEQKVK